MVFKSLAQARAREIDLIDTIVETSQGIVSREQLESICRADDGWGDKLDRIIGTCEDMLPGYSLAPFNELAEVIKYIFKTERVIVQQMRQLQHP